MPQTEDEEPQPQTTAYGDAHESEARPSTTPLEKLASKVENLEADIGLVLVNQSYIIHLLYLCVKDNVLRIVVFNIYVLMTMYY